MASPNIATKNAFRSFYGTKSISVGEPCLCKFFIFFRYALWQNYKPK